MNTKNKLNCYIFSNLIISVLSLNFLVNPPSSTLVIVDNPNGTLNKIYEKEVPVIVPEVVPEVIPETTTIITTNKEVQSQNTNTNITYIKPSYNSITGASLVNYAKHYLGLPYVYAGNSLTTGTDCSGFTKLIFKEFGINLGRTVNSQIYSGTYVKKEDLKPGDLVFYGHSSGNPSHVGIYIGSDLVIHESKPGDVVKISSVNMMVYITARRLITENIQKEVVIEEKKEESIEENPKEDIIPDKEINVEVEKEENVEIKDENIQKEELKEEIVEDKKEVVDNDSLIESHPEEEVEVQNNNSLEDDKLSTEEIIKNDEIQDVIQEKVEDNITK